MNRIWSKWFGPVISVDFGPTPDYNGPQTQWSLAPMTWDLADVSVVMSTFHKLGETTLRAGDGEDDIAVEQIPRLSVESLNKLRIVTALNIADRVPSGFLTLHLFQDGPAKLRINPAPPQNVLDCIDQLAKYWQNNTIRRMGKNRRRALTLVAPVTAVIAVFVLAAISAWDIAPSISLALTLCLAAIMYGGWRAAAHFVVERDLNPGADRIMIRHMSRESVDTERQGSSRVRRDRLYGAAATLIVGLIVAGVTWLSRL